MDLFRAPSVSKQARGTRRYLTLGISLSRVPRYFNGFCCFPPNSKSSQNRSQATASMKMQPMNKPNAYQKPPNDIRAVFKKYQRMSLVMLDNDPVVVDFTRVGSLMYNTRVRVVRTIIFPELTEEFAGPAGDVADLSVSRSIQVFEHPDLPGGLFKSKY